MKAKTENENENNKDWWLRLKNKLKDKRKKHCDWKRSKEGAEEINTEWNEWLKILNEIQLMKIEQIRLTQWVTEYT